MSRSHPQLLALGILLMPLWTGFVRGFVFPSLLSQTQFPAPWSGGAGGPMKLQVLLSPWVPVASLGCVKGREML